MHTKLLQPLFSPIRLPHSAETVSKLATKSVNRPSTLLLMDLLFQFPTSQINRPVQHSISHLTNKTISTVRVFISKHQVAPPNSNMPHKVFAQDNSGIIKIIYFSVKPAWLKKLFPIGETRWISGKIEWYNGCPQMVHPDYVAKEHELTKIPAVEMVYSQTKNIPGTTVARIINENLKGIPDLPEWIDNRIVKLNQWPSFKQSLTILHTPEHNTAKQPNLKVRALERLAYDELLSNQLSLAMINIRDQNNNKVPIVGTACIQNKILRNLPFKLTGNQLTAKQAIISDMKKPQQMIRLLQGDVGSGKTIVSLLVATVAVEAKRQVAIMTPTDLLARQHFETFHRFSTNSGVRISLLTSRDKNKARKQILEAVSRGQVDILVGTHAIIQKDVTFKNLSLAIIDEQQRFGVEQRLSLFKKGDCVDVLVMTATPIPRTLLMANFGDIAVSQLVEKPKNRKPIITRTIAETRLIEVVRRLSIAIKNGDKAYWVCPLLKESETSDLAAAKERQKKLISQLGPVVGIIYGKMHAKDKMDAWNDFISGKTKVLVATTVIEVGADIPDATVMIIEQAQRFGLSQLHQLRGRVGRGTKASYCLLMYTEPISKLARARLNTIRTTENGFRIAEEDLKHRGGGDIVGNRQSGLKTFRIANYLLQKKLLPTACAEARKVVAIDPSLASPQGKALQLVLHLFGNDVTDNDRHKAP